MNNYYNLYIESIFRLVETMTIKFGASAEAQNNKIRMVYGSTAVDDYDPTTWKYYQNIAGQYHWSDQAMNIVSLDTKRTILFDKVNLKTDVATRKAYAYGSVYYRDLVARFPQQELLILGVLYAPDPMVRPTFVQDAIASQDGTILYYDVAEIEENEYSLLSELQTWVYQYLNRWVNPAFYLSGDLYAATVVAQLFIQLVPAIINLRLLKCKSNETHSFHIRQYLASHGGLDRFLDTLTRDQALFLYRNILYIQKNAGKRETFDWLVENIMTVRGIPLYEYTAKHDLGLMISAEGKVLSYDPTVVFRRKPLNVTESDKLSVTYGLAQMLDRIKNSAPGNEVFQEYEAENINLGFIDSPSNVVCTKVLESRIDDYSETAPYPLAQILLNQWLYWASTDQYLALVEITVPNTKKTISITAKQALIIYIYALSEALGLGLTHIPQLIAKRVKRDVLPSLEEIHSITEKKYIRDEDIMAIRDTFEEALALTSVEAFNSNCNFLYTAMWRQTRLISLTENDHRTAQFQTAVDRHYADYTLSLTDQPTTFAAWLASMSLDYSQYDKSELLAFSDSIVADITGASLDDRPSIKKIQRAMLEILQQLCSYSVLFISDVNNGAVFMAPGKQTKLMDIHSIEHDRDSGENPIHTVQHTDVQGDDRYSYLDNNNTVFDLDGSESSNLRVAVDYFGYLGLQADPTLTDQVEMTPFAVINTDDPFEQFATLTLEQRSTLRSIYQ